MLGYIPIIKFLVKETVDSTNFIILWPLCLSVWLDASSFFLILGIQNTIFPSSHLQLQNTPTVQASDMSSINNTNAVVQLSSGQNYETSNNTLLSDLPDNIQRKGFKKCPNWHALQSTVIPLCVVLSDKWTTNMFIHYDSSVAPRVSFLFTAFCTRRCHVSLYLSTTGQVLNHLATSIKAIFLLQNWMRGKVTVLDACVPEMHHIAFKMTKILQNHVQNM